MTKKIHKNVLKDMKNYHKKMSNVLKHTEKFYKGV